MSYTVDTPVQCRYCGHTSESMAAACDHAEDAHNIVTNAVLDSVELVGESAGEAASAEATPTEATDDD